MEVMDESSQVQDGLADQVDSGMEGSAPAEQAEPEEHSEGSHSRDTLAVQKRLKAQRRAHEREVRELHARIGDLENRMGSQPPDQTTNPYGQPEMGGSVDETIHKAVSYALRQKEEEERKAREAKSAMHVQKKYQEFHNHLDNMHDKYDDFGDVVMGQDVPFTPVMRDYAARTMSKHGPGSAGEVLYKLGKNRPELERIASLHPDDQAEELHKLSLALSRGDEAKNAAQSQRPLGQIKSNPVSHNSASVTDKTPIGSIRQRMKSGNWK